MQNLRICDFDDVPLNTTHYDTIFKLHYKSFGYNELHNLNPPAVVLE